MTGHDAFIELAATAVDFELSPADRVRLDEHLASCAACRSVDSTMRSDGRALAAIPVLPLGDAKSARIVASIVAPPVVPYPLRLMAVAALLALLAIGSVVVGSQLLHRASQDDLSIVVPVPGPSAAVTPTLPAVTPVLGSIWEGASVPVTAGRPVGRIEAVTAGGPGFVAVGRGCAMSGGDPVRCEAVVWTSTDGRAWQRAPASDATDIGVWITMSGPENGMFGVAAGPPGVVAIGYSARPAFDAAVWFSPDGTSWERLSMPLGDAGNAALRPQAVTWSGDRFVIVGEDRTAFSGDVRDLATARAAAAVWTSSDGRTWARVPDGPVFDAGGFIDTMEDPSSGGMRDVVAGPVGLEAVGGVCDATAAGVAAHCTPAAWLSSDGSAWSRAAMPAELDGSLRAIAATPAGYVAVGEAGCGGNPTVCPALVLTSGDGRTWVRRDFSQPGYLDDVLSVGDRLFAIAPEGPTALWTSPDGSDWTPAEDDPVGPSIAQRPPSIMSETHLAATREVAVWVGSAGETDPSPVAWYSSAAGTP